MEMVEGAWKAVDMRVTQLVWSLLRNVMGVELTGTPTTKGLPLIDSPTPIVVAITIYLSCVIGGLLWIKTSNLKPRAQEPALLQALVLLHNLFCFGLSLYMCVGIIYQAILNRYFLLSQLPPLNIHTILHSWNLEGGWVFHHLVEDHWTTTNCILELHSSLKGNCKNTHKRSSAFRRAPLLAQWL